MEKYNVSTNFVDTANGKSTGIAQINVAENGDNQIVIIPGANDVLSPTDVEKAQDVLDSSKVKYYISCQIFSLKHSIILFEGFGLSIGNTITSDIGSSSEIQKWDFYSQCITSTK